jgi:hypothetical protein
VIADRALEGLINELLRNLGFRSYEESLPSRDFVITCCDEAVTSMYRILHQA